MQNILFLVIAAVGLLLGGYAIFKQPKPLEPANTNIEAPAVDKLPLLAEKPISNALDLSNRQFKKVPDYVFSRTNLEELNISGNQITGAIQAEIRHLQNLKALNAGNNLMTGVPAEIGQLKNLQILDLSNNQLTGLPYELGNLKNLKTLNISGTVIQLMIWISYRKICQAE